MIIHIPTGKRFNNRKEAKIYFGSAYYYKIEKEKKDLLFINNIQSATNEYSTPILQKQCNRQLDSNLPIFIDFSVCLFQEMIGIM